MRQEKGSHRASSGQGGREGHHRVIHTLLVQVFSSFLSACSTDDTPLGNQAGSWHSCQQEKIRGYEAIDGAALMASRVIVPIWPIF